MGRCDAPQVTHRYQDKEYVLGTLGGGSHFGEMRTGQVILRTTSTRALVLCTCYSISRDHLNVVLGNFPQARKQVGGNVALHRNAPKRQAC